ncbi:DUF1816 domain-containing protein [Pleurocapsa sp. PCC 7319]|uniref:DUF1816 domain-containing protein n=1 Tax=Pleurocapsa sp. PCC 7319 TaxID=118161 RepID=UPI00034CC898|nr:DUF1816 domain-containing protein [Pleurocapsa sp. PCC 7319]
MTKVNLIEIEKNLCQCRIKEEARQVQYGYIEDLIAGKAMKISVKIKRSLPIKLTIRQ